MYLVYFDESGDDGYPQRSSDLFVLAAVFLPVSRWRATQLQLLTLRRDLAARHGFPLRQEFHTREFLLDKNPYHGKYTPAQRRAMLFEYVTALAALPIQVAVVVVDKTTLPAPPFAVLEAALRTSIAQLAASTPVAAPLLLLTDEGRVENMTRVVRELQAWQAAAATPLATRLIEDVLPKTSAASLLVQVADAVAFLSFTYALKHVYNGPQTWANRLNAVLSADDSKALLELLRPLLPAAADAENHFGLQFLP